MENHKRLILLGKQGAGKGTQATRLARHFGLPHVATGDIFRAAVRSGSEFGREAKRFMDTGDYVPDDIVIGMVRERLAADDARSGFLLDGFPRNVAQADALEEILAPERVDLVVNLEVPTEVVLLRLAGRRVCTECGANYSTETPPRHDWRCDVCGGEVIVRQDDTESAISRRLALYEERTNPLIAWYSSRGCLVTVDGVGPPGDVTRRLVEAIEGRFSDERPVLGSKSALGPC